MTKVWTYWECQSCGSILRGDIRTCPNCGTPVANTTKYLMPDNPKVISALSSGKIITTYNTSIDEKGIVAEVVPQSLERTRPNWLCTFCGYQNYDESDTCEGCGNPRTPETPTYFDDIDNLESDQPSNLDNLKFAENALSKLSDSVTKISEQVNQVYQYVEEHNPRKIGIIISSIVLAIFLLWLFFPIKHTATICGFHWDRAIDVVEYTECHESGWTLPAGAELEYTSLELHHYNEVLDHYETKSREVAEQVFDGYDTSYRDLGNGQADVVQTPRYRTEYHTEYYEEPVYRQEPVYEIKYYYEIGRWLYSYDLPTSGNDREPYWQETNIPETVNFPSYGDVELDARHENYYAVVIDYTDSQQNVPYSYDDWMTLNVGDDISYYTFRFSNKPLFGT